MTQLYLSMVCVEHREAVTGREGGKVEDKEEEKKEEGCMERLMAAVKVVLLLGLFFDEACTETWVERQKHKTGCIKITPMVSLCFFVPCRCGTIPKWDYQGCHGLYERTETTKKITPKRKKFDGFSVLRPLS